MHNKMMSVLVVGGVFLLSGCGATKKMTVQSYIEDHPRADLDLSQGNAGYLVGSPSVEAIGRERATIRKMLVVEVTKPANIVDTKILNYDETKVQTTLPPQREKKSVIQQGEEPELQLPSFEDENVAPDTKPSASDQQVAPSMMTGEEEYTIQKDDTLQKISEKFYSTSKRWYKIYEFNKDTIKDPDHIIPGTVIRIPLLK